MTARVLIVDDLTPNLKLIEARLSAEYFEVLTATNGADALALCASGKCDIVLLDVMMPGMDAKGPREKAAAQMLPTLLNRKSEPAWL
jgi:CheY-like chemotaxis protein